MKNLKLKLTLKIMIDFEKGEAQLWLERFNLRKKNGNENLEAQVY